MSEKLLSRPALALYQPDIPQNTGGILRLSACFDLPVHIIEPCGFPLDEKRLRRVAMDYYHLVSLKRHRSWEDFLLWSQSEGKRLLLLTTKTDRSYIEFTYGREDILIMGRESAGAPEKVHQACHRLTIPLQKEARSLNMVTAATLAMGEALRQTGTFPEV